MAEAGIVVLKGYARAIKKVKALQEFPFEKLEIGDAFFAPGESGRSMGRRCNKAGIELGRRFESERGVHEGVEGAFVYCVQGAPPPTLKPSPRTAARRKKSEAPAEPTQAPAGGDAFGLPPIGAAAAE